MREARPRGRIVAGALLAAALLIAVIGAAPRGDIAVAAGTAQLAQPLDGAKTAIAETNLGNLAADAMRAATNADFALVQASAIQPVTVAAGNLSEDEIRGLLVFPDDTVTVLRLDGAHIAETLERSLAMLPYPNKGFLQISGLHVRFDPRGAPGARLRAATVDATGAPLAAATVYRVAVPDSLALGALGYFRVFNSAPRERTQVTLNQALSRFAAAGSPLAPRVEGRIQAQP